jgi:hypothetical protein
LKRSRLSLVCDLQPNHAAALRRPRRRTVRALTSVLRDLRGLRDFVIRMRVY